ncbi:MAG: hypothetical protein NC079_08240 [Clostridium sp.]|nr:hypothetical protein [Acetatifactor muris]MCM1527304.1 hypothetical protein [Bacteroides sp.]MCM1563583.1 hypothetical protein [Clostridium sp.]
MNQSRTRNSIKNITYSMLSYGVILFLEFVNRTIFIHLLTDEYLGLNGLFSNILSFLSLAELGVGSAINYALYKPLSTGDYELVKSIMRLYRKLYRIIGCTILIIGGSLTPLLPYLISDMPKDMPNISIYYLLYALNSGMSYFYAYKRSLIVCDQKSYITSIVNTFSKIILSVAQIVILKITHSYISYLCMAIVVTITENIFISIAANKLYPFLRDKWVQPLAKSEIADIKKNVFALLFHKIGSQIVFSTDNIIISGFVGLIPVGLYSNYTLIVNAISATISRIFSAITASVGNLVLSHDKEHIEEVFYRVLFANFWIRSFSAISLFCLVQPFIQLWVGESYLLSQGTVLVIAINFYITGMRLTVVTFKDASGLFWPDRYKPLVECVINIALSIPLAIRYGVAGVLLGTIGSTLGVAFWVEGYVLFKHLFAKNMKTYLLKQLYYAGITVVVGAFCYFLNLFFVDGGMGEFILRILICLIVPNGIYMLWFWRTNECKYFWGLIKRQLKRGKFGTP